MPESAPLTVGTIILDPERWIVTVAGRAVPFTKKEFQLLRALLDAHGRVLTYGWLMDHVWDGGAHLSGKSRIVGTYMRYLRYKLGPEATRIQTVREVGYRLNCD